MATSRVPAAIAALVALLRGAAGLDGVQVIDGPPTGGMEEADYVAVGWDPGGEAAVVMAQEFAGAGARTRDEEFTITCCVDAWTGGDDIASVRHRVFELLGAVEDALRASAPSPDAPSLGGTVLWSHLTSGSLTQANTSQGVRALITFAVSCRARI
ncbi:hypothetical protein [Streptomyces cucumeris]|uniref:hypothetical protein n=1 Tax=Streptomyces cucumeris TaxID=2962890 RepID=UPI0020C90458|nr:hypothetical protein [Streptomyces sp. NEAU-Y11]MCP9209284.1 hypothetical protein [Streptomyces sp. NEAU-Y11]